MDNELSRQIQTTRLWRSPAAVLGAIRHDGPDPLLSGHTTAPTPDNVPEPLRKGEHATLLFPLP